MGNRVGLAGTDSIASGQTKAFNFTITAPSTPGTYNFQWRMVEDGVAWFGDVSPNVVVNVVAATPTFTPTPALAPLNAQFVSQIAPPTQMVAGQTANVQVVMQNTGGNTWTAANLYRLGSQNPHDTLNWGMGNRVGLAATDAIATGQTEVFNFTVTAPSTPGTYNFQWGMVQDGVAWFGDVSPNVVVSVVAPMAK